MSVPNQFQGLVTRYYVGIANVWCGCDDKRPDIDDIFSLVQQIPSTYIMFAIKLLINGRTIMGELTYIIGTNRYAYRQVYQLRHSIDQRYFSAILSSFMTIWICEYLNWMVPLHQPETTHLLHCTPNHQFDRCGLNQTSKYVVHLQVSRVTESKPVKMQVCCAQSDISP